MGSDPPLGHAALRASDSSLELFTVRAVRIPLLLASAGSLALAFPTADVHLLAWVALVPVFGSALVRPPRNALADGWLVGAVFFTLLLRWLDHTFQTYSAIPWPLTWLPIVGLAGYLGLYVGGVAAGTSWLARSLGTGWALTAAPFLWVTSEWVRGHLLSGFPWGLLGYSQYRQLALIQVAEWTGVYGVSFLIVLVNAALVGLLAGWRRGMPGLVGAAGVLLLTVGLGRDGVRMANDRVLPVAIVQPSIEQAIKWDPDFQARALAVYRGLTIEAARSAPAVVVWPETAVPAVLRRDPAMLEGLTRLAGAIGAPLILGAVDARPGPGADRYYNSALLLSAKGIEGTYDKIHLVPFGEYIPLRRLIGFVQQWAEFISDFAAGTRQTVFSLAEAPFGVVICYEGVFPELFRDFVARGALWMVNMTNDAWFGQTSGPWQHLAMLPFRAVEHRVAIARAANTGISAFIDPSGRIHAMLPLFERGVLTARLPLRRTVTFYTRFGDLFAYLCLGLTGLVGLWAFRQRAAGPAL